MKSVINIKNDGNQNGHYPLFLGDDLGFADTINLTYPQIDEMYKLQRSQFWTEEEFSLESDRKDLEECDPKIRDVMLLNLLSQWLMDSVASRSILQVLGPFASNNELYDLLTVWSFFEGIHARDYSRIVRNCFADPNEAIERGKSDMHVAYRSKIIGEIFNETSQMATQYTQGELSNKNPEHLSIMRKQLLVTVAAIYALEATAFMASFACTFALTTEKFQGIATHVSSICNDEVAHAAGGAMILSLMINKEGYDRELQDVLPRIRQVFDEVINQEFSWAEYIFSEGRTALGLNTEVLKDYIRFVGAPMYHTLGMDFDEDKFGKVPGHDPLPYMHKYIDRDLVQSANQEIENNSYRIAQTDSDVDDDEVFDF